MPRHAFCALIFAAMLGSAIRPAMAQPLSLAEYLDQVKKTNLALSAAESQNAALDLATKEVETAFSPMLDAAYSYYDSRENPANPLNFTTENIQSAWNVSVTKLWGTGTKTTLSLANSASLGVLVPSLLALTGGQQPGYAYTMIPSLTISQPLWKNFMAKGIGATLRKVDASARMGQALGEYGIQATLFGAESAYLALEMNRVSVDLLKSSLERNQKILAWSQRRAAQNLADRSDVLQSEAAVSQLQIGLKSAEDELAVSLRNFNSFRNAGAADIPGELDELVPPLEEPRRDKERADVKAAGFDLDSRKAAIDEIVDRYSPDVRLFATLGLNGSADNPYAARDQVATFTSQYPSYLVGASLNLNLDVPLYRQVLAGAKLAAKSGDASLQDKKNALDLDWANLMDHWKSAVQRLDLARQLEALQKEKADREKERFNNGRTTNFQVLRFEDDYFQARLGTLRVILELRVLAATARLYNGEF